MRRNTTDRKMTTSNNSWEMGVGERENLVNPYKQNFQSFGGYSQYICMEVLGVQMYSLHRSHGPPHLFNTPKHHFFPPKLDNNLKAFFGFTFVILGLCLHLIKATMCGLGRSWRHTVVPLCIPQSHLHFANCQETGKWWHYVFSCLWNSGLLGCAGKARREGEKLPVNWKVWSTVLLVWEGISKVVKHSWHNSFLVLS